MAWLFFAVSTVLPVLSNLVVRMLNHIRIARLDRIIFSGVRQTAASRVFVKAGSSLKKMTKNTAADPGRN